MRYCNPYHFIFFIPIAIIAGLVYYLFAYGREISSLSFIVITFVIFGAITFLGYQISKQNHPLRGMHHERGEVEDIVQKVIESKLGKISDQELKELKDQVHAIYNSSNRRAERTMRLKALLDEYTKNKSHPD